MDLEISPSDIELSMPGLSPLTWRPGVFAASSGRVLIEITIPDREGSNTVREDRQNGRSRPGLWGRGGENKS